MKSDKYFPTKYWRNLKRLPETLGHLLGEGRRAALVQHLLPLLLLPPGAADGQLAEGHVTVGVQGVPPAEEDDDDDDDYDDDGIGDRLPGPPHEVLVLD